MGFCMKLYELEWFTLYKQPALTAPKESVLVPAAFWENEISHWVKLIWQPGWGAWFLTPALMRLMMGKWFVALKYGRGLPSGAAFAGAKVNMMNWISTQVAAEAVPLLTLWGGVVMLGVTFSFLSWLEGSTATIWFRPGRFIMRYEERLWWAGLMGRPEEKVYYCYRGPELPLHTFFHQRIDQIGIPDMDFFHFTELWQTVHEKLLHWDVLSWTTAKARFIGVGHERGGGMWNFWPSEYWKRYWGVPVGWGLKEADAIGWVDDLADYANPPGDPPVLL